jgi:antitoxin (DNA-binding transcriptional repressor) of toxin-antitoxin stability system
MRVSVTEAKTRLSELVGRAKAEDGVVLTCHSQPEVQLVLVKRVPIDHPGSGEGVCRRKARREARISFMMIRICHGVAADTSALMAILLRKVEAEACKATPEAKPEVMISAGTVAAALIGAARRNIGERRDCDYDCPP